MCLDESGYRTEDLNSHDCEGQGCQGKNEGGLPIGWGDTEDAGAKWQSGGNARRPMPEIEIEIPEEEVRFTAIDDTGRFLHCDVLFMMKQGGRHYIVYTDGDVTCDGETRVYASIYDPAGLVTFSDGDHCALSLEPITDSGAWGLIEHVLDLLSEQLEIDG